MLRRKFLIGVSGLLVLFSGCVDLIDELRDGGGDNNDQNGIPPDQGGITDPPPEPELVDIDVNFDISGIFDVEAQVYATVLNHGGPGDIIIEVEFTGQDRTTVIDRYQKHTTIRDGERRRYTIDVSPPRDAERYRVRVDTD